MAKGYTQHEGRDYLDTFSPVAKLATVILLLSLEPVYQWSLTQLDVTNTFVHGDLDEFYMSLPSGYSYHDGEPFPANVVCKLHKSLYGLKQASQQWFHKFSSVLLTSGFIQSSSDHPLFTKKNGNLLLALLIYVDDIIITDNDDHEVEALKCILNSRSKMKDLGPLKYFLVLEIARSV